jgi:very-short-patch-repair endonuclease
VSLSGLTTTRPDVAAVRAAMWARSDRAGATVMAMAVQQRLATGADVLLEAKRLNRHKRRPLILAVAKDIATGAQALSELDFAALCRRRRLPEPTRQRVRRGAHGRAFLDVSWDELNVAVEVEGAHHDAPENAVDDALRQNALTIGRLGVLRVPVLGLRTCPDLFMDQVESMLRTAVAGRSGSAA